MKKVMNSKLIWAIFPLVAVILLGILVGLMMKEKPETSQRESDKVEEPETTPAVVETKTEKDAEPGSYEELDELYKNYFMMGTA